MSISLFSCGGDDEEVKVERINTDYSPNTVGSTWTYSYIGDFTQTNTILNKAKEIDGKAYYALKIKNSLSPTVGVVYFRKDGSDYIALEPIAGFYENREAIIMKEGQVGTTWSLRMFPDTEDEITLVNEIVELDGVYTFNEEEFTNVMVVKAYASQGEWEEEPENPPYSLNYYAKGIGYIRSVDNEGTTLMELVSYTIH